MSKVDYSKSVVVPACLITAFSMLLLWIDITSGRLEEFFTLLFIVSISAIVTDFSRVGVANFLSEVFDIETKNHIFEMLWQSLFIVFTAAVSTGEGLVEDLYIITGVFIIYLYFLLKSRDTNNIPNVIFTIIHVFIVLLFTFLATVTIVQRGGSYTFAIVILLAVLAVVGSIIYEMNKDS